MLSRLAAILVALTLLALPGQAQDNEAQDAAQLARVMMLQDAAEVMRQEGRALGDEMARDMLGGDGGALWQERIARLYESGLMVDTVSGALAEGLTPAQAEAVTAFFDTDQGRRILTLETDARRAMIDPDIEEIARQTYDDLRGSDDPRLALVSEFIAVNDLLERNVAGALSSDYRFTSGMVEGGALAMHEDEILAEVWASEEEIREDTESWLYGYLLLAYRPLSDAELRDYIDFSRSDAGQALNAALFAGFEHHYAGISQALGLALAQAMQGSEL